MRAGFKNKQAVVPEHVRVNTDVFPVPLGVVRADIGVVEALAHPVQTVSNQVDADVLEAVGVVSPPDSSEPVAEAARPSLAAPPAGAVDRHGARRSSSHPG